MPRRTKPGSTADVAAAISAEELQQLFPAIDLPINPPFPPTETRNAAELPQSGDWFYEPKWDGFRCLAFTKNKGVLLQSKAGQLLARYFPKLVAGFKELPQMQFVLDGEIVILREGDLDFNALLERIHPAESRIRRLARETPVTFLCFDILLDEAGRRLTSETLEGRRRDLASFFARVAKAGPVRLSPATPDFTKAQR